MVLTHSSDDTSSTLRKVVVYKFTVTDVEDPDLWAGEPLWNWQESIPGKFVMEHAIEPPSWHRTIKDFIHYEYIIVATLPTKKLLEFYLKWGENYEC